MADVRVHRFGHRKSGLYTVLMLPERPFCRSGLPDRACGRSSRSFLRVWWDRGMRHLALLGSRVHEALPPGQADAGPAAGSGVAMTAGLQLRCMGPISAKPHGLWPSAEDLLLVEIDQQ
jgi:hypothetical protein